jgi:branched-chain amino acid transport system ATP-binding protein
MLAIGRALMANPELMLLDEPTTGLAPIIVDTIARITKTIQKAGTTVLLVEQNVKQALRLAHRAYVLENGELILQGSASELAGNPHVRKAYLGI